MRTSELGFWEWLLCSSSKLVELGVPREAVVDMRFEATGHLRAAPVTWAHAYFSWGGVETVARIGEITQHTPEQVRQYAKDAGLRFATRSRRRTHAELAVLLWCDRFRSPRESCAEHGVPPGARRILCSAMQVLVDSADGGVKEVLGWEFTRLEQQFADLRLDLQPPRSVLAAVPGTPREALRAAR
jgi:hypothetical protein